MKKSSSSAPKPPTIPQPQPRRSSDDSDHDDEEIQPSTQYPIIDSLNDRLSSLEGLIRGLAESQQLIQQQLSQSPSAQDNAMSVSSSSATSFSSTSLVEPGSIIADSTIPINPTPPILETRSVPRKNWATTSASVSAMFLANRIHSTTKDSFVKISMVRGGLSTAGLKDLLDGHRTKPIISAQNKFGYRERSISTITYNDENTGVEIVADIMLEEDDCFCYAYDMGRLYQAVIEIFGQSLHFLVPKEIEANDGQMIYKKIMQHLNGQLSIDAAVARQAFDKYVMNESLTFKQEFAKFSEVFKTLEYAQKRVLESNEKIAFLQDRLLRDGRLGLKDMMVQAIANDYDYDHTLRLLIKISTEVGDRDQVVKLANVHQIRHNNNNNSQNNNFNSHQKNNSNTNENKKQIKYCFNWNESGECQFGTSCRYEHIKDPNHLTRERRAPPQYQKATEKESTPVTKSCRTNDSSNIKKSRYKGKNPRPQLNQLSTLNENATLKTLNVNNNNELKLSSTSSNFNSWGDTSLAPYEPPINNNKNETMNMMKNIIDNENKEEIPSILINRSRILIHAQYLQIQHGRREKGTEHHYPEPIHCLPHISQRRFFKKNLIQLKYPCTVKYETEDGEIISTFTGFNWNPRCPITGTIKEEVRQGYGSLMELIYRNNEVFLSAKICHALPVRKQSRDHAGAFKDDRYMNFIDKRFAEGTPGAYQSILKNIQQYITILVEIKNEYITRRSDIDGDIYFDESTLMLLLWSLCYDFMSCCAIQYGNNFEQRNIAIRTSRAQLTESISAIPSDEFKFSGMKDCFLAIAHQSKGLSYINNENEMHDDSEIENNTNTESSDESASESDTEYIAAPPNSNRKFKRMSIYNDDNIKFSTQRKHQYKSADAIKLEQMNNK